jgi:hypothetical protein
MEPGLPGGYESAALFERIVTAGTVRQRRLAAAWRFGIRLANWAWPGRPGYGKGTLNLNQANPRQRLLPAEFYVVPCRIIAQLMRTSPRKTGAIFFFVWASDIERYRARWSVFGKRVS